MVGIESDDDRHIFLTPHVRVEFAWQHDRWVHTLTPLGACQTLPGLSSLEGDPDRDDPARVVSPAYQQAHVEVGPDTIPRMLVVGQSGPHHFSAAFAVTTDEQGTTFEADVADRCRLPIEALAATYQVEATDAHIDGDGQAELTWSDAGSRLALLAMTPTTLAVHSAGPGNKLHTQVNAALQSASHTHRFHYRWRWSVG